MYLFNFNYMIVMLPSFILIIAAHATAPILILVGFLMMEPLL